MALIKHNERYGPYMTANNAPAPYVASASQNNWGAFRAFSENLEDDISFTGLAAGTEQWVQIKLDAAIRIWAFRIACRTTVSAKDAGQVPKDFVVQGSVDGATFEDVQAYTDVEWTQFTSWDATINKYDWSDSKKIEVTCVKKYQYYRIKFGECQSISAQKQGSMTPVPSNTVKLTLIDLYQAEGDASAEVAGIRILSLPNKVRYEKNEEFVPDGLIVTADKLDGTSEEITDYTLSGFDNSKAGILDILVSYLDFTATFKVTVTDPFVKGITIEHLPAKTEYLYGQDLDVSGMTVLASFADDTTAYVTDYVVYGYTSTVLGKQTVTVFYGGIEASFTVTVLNAVSGIEVTPPAKQLYLLGDSFDATGMAVKAVWLDGTKTDAADYTLSGFDSSTTGKKSVTVAYLDFTKTFTVTVEERIRQYVLGDNVSGTHDRSTKRLVITGTGKMKDFTLDDRPRNVYVNFNEIESVIIENGVTSIGSYAFYSCDNLKSVIAPESVTSIGIHTFQYSGLQEINMPEGVTSIGEYAFYGCDIQSITIPGGVADIGPYTFHLCTSLQSAVISKGVKTIGEDSFSDCYKLQSIDIPESVTTIGKNAFSGCNAVKSVIIPENVKSIGMNAFWSCDALEDVSIFNDTVEIGNSSITFPESTVIHGRPNSTANSYATRYGRKFVALDSGYFRVIFIDWDGRELSSQTIVPGGAVTEPAHPSRAGYTFVGWDKDFSNVISDLTVTAQYEINIHTVVFKDWDGTVLKSATVEYGGAAIPPEGPVRDGYRFTGWDVQFSAVESDLTVTAQYEEIEAGLTGLEVTTLPTKLEYVKGDEFDQSGLVVSKVYLDGSREAVADYTLSGFDSSAPGKVTVTVSYLEFTASFTVTVVMPSAVGITISSLPDKLKYGLTDTFDSTGLTVTASYSDNTQVLVADYTISGFDSTETGIKRITVTYLEFTAGFDVEVMPDVTVTFNDLYGNLIGKQVIHYGHSATPPAVVEIYGFTFSGWSYSPENVTQDTICQAQYTVQTYKVEFKDHNGAVLKTETVRYMDDAVPPSAPSRTGYLFTGWDKPYTDITADTVITATYSQYAAVTGIELQAACTAINGETVNIPYKVLPEAANNKGVSITVSDSTVIDVSYGSGWIICEAINTGAATITVTSTEDNSISASCTVTVAADDAVTGISLYPPELMLQKGKTEEIAVSVSGGADVDESVVWTSSNTAVVTVKNGKVKGIAEGTATITARLKSDASFYATCSVTVEDKKDFIIEAYKKGSLPKPITIHSVGNKFADITGKYIDGESMVVKESICDSQTLKLGGCIANSFEILIQDERLMTKAPEGEIQVYQTIEGNRVDLFNGVIYSAKRIGNSLQRKIVAYDKLYSKGNKDMTAWFKKLKLPMSIKQFRTQLFKKIGIKQASVTLDIDGCMISPASYKIKSPIVEFPSGNVVEHETFEIENYTASTSAAKASDIIRDLCEAAGMCGWMNRKGVFEYIDFDVPEEAGLDSPISVTCGEKYYSVKCTALKKDDLEWFEGHKEVYVGESVTPDGVIVDAYVQVEYKSEVENATYIMDDNNFIVQIVVVNNPLSKYHLEGLVPITQAVHSRASKPCQQFECQRRFNPYIKLGTAIRDEVKKETSEGKLYTWELNSVILSRTIKGSQSMLETISAKNGPFNASNDTSKKNIKTVHVTQELNMKKISMLNNTKLSGVYMTKSEFDAADIQDSNTETYFVRFD